MPDAEKPDEKQERLTREAAKIFLRLRTKPEDKQALDARDAFLARGEDEREIYASMDRAAYFAGREIKSKRNRTNAMAILGACLALLHFAMEPVRFYFLADFQTGQEAQNITLDSGDRVTLDAASALSDVSDIQTRRIELLSGAAFFDVEKDRRAFIVEAGSIQVSVLGTAFDVSRNGDAVIITVAEGRVRVEHALETWELSAGDRLFVRDEAPAVRLDLDQEDSDVWRQDQLLTNGMNFAQVATVLDRRIRGEVLILGSELAQTQISGLVDIEDPIAALENLAATRNARVLRLPLVTLVTP